MPRTSGRWGIVILGVVWGWAAGVAFAQSPVAPISTVAGPTVLPAAEPELPVKDLTPPGFADHPPADHAHHERPGYLNPAVPEGHGLFGAAEYLLFRARRGAFDYAVLNSTRELATTGAVDSLNYELRSGVRAELGYRFGGGWEAFTNYTYYRTGANQTATAGPDQVLFPTLTRPGLTDRAQFAAADANLEYNVYDLLAGRRFAADEHLAFRVFGGFRFASIRQDFQVVYDGVDARRAAASAPSDFQGFGPLVGADAVLVGWHGFHLYGRATGGLLTGTTRNPLVETNNAGGTVYANLGSDDRAVVPVVGVGVGGGWQYRTVTVRVGYEITHWFGVINQPRFTDDVAQGKFVTRQANLSLEGLFVQVGLSF